MCPPPEIPSPLHSLVPAPQVLLLLLTGCSFSVLLTGLSSSPCSQMWACPRPGRHTSSLPPSPSELTFGQDTLNPGCVLTAPMFLRPAQTCSPTPGPTLQPAPHLPTGWLRRTSNLTRSGQALGSNSIPSTHPSCRVPVLPAHKAQTLVTSITPSYDPHIQSTRKAHSNYDSIPPFSPSPSGHLVQDLWLGQVQCPPDLSP